MNKKMIITNLVFHQQTRTVTALESDGRVVELAVSGLEHKGILDNIYIGKVTKIVPHIHAAFIDIGNNTSCYYSLEEHSSQAPLKNGDELVVQVRTEAIKSKIPTVTTNLNLTGRYLVLTTQRPGIGLSNKLEPEQKTLLKKWLQPHVRQDCGLIIRTNAQDVDKETLLEELDYLYRRLERIRQYGESRTCYSLLEEAYPEYIHTLRGISSADLECVVTDDLAVYDKVNAYLSDFQKDDLAKLRFYEDDLLPLYKLYSLEHVLENALKEKVWLKSGGFLMIQQTEAFVAIDVNSGKYQGRKKPQETYRKINLEAAKEIAIQLRLRNLSGIILIDFINMEHKEHNLELMNVLQKHLRSDTVKAVVIDMTALHIVEVTRKKVRRSLIEQVYGTE